MDYIGEVGFKALGNIGVTSSFATLDVNGDRRIDKSDAKATSNSKIKSEINTVLEKIKMYDRFSEACGFSTEINFMNPNLYKEHPELAEILGYDESSVISDEQLANMGIAGQLLGAFKKADMQPQGVYDEYLNNKWGNPEGVKNTPHFTGYDVEYAKETGSFDNPLESTNTESTTNKESANADYRQKQAEKRENELKAAENEYAELENEIKEKREEYDALMEKINSAEAKEDTSNEKAEAETLEYDINSKNRNLQSLADDIKNMKLLINIAKSIE